MLDAYKIGITVALTNNISKGLTLIGKDFAKTEAQAAKLKLTLKEIKKLAFGGAILGGIGYAGFKMLDSGYEAAKKYEQAFAQFKSLNLGDAVNAQADKFARGANIIGASATDLMQTARDLTAVLGNADMAKQLAPGFAQLKFANQAIYGGHGMNFDERQIRDLERIIEMKGGFKSSADFLRQGSMMQQAIASTGGLVRPSDYLQFIKTSGVSGRLLTDKAFYYGLEPLIQEMGGGRVGTGLMSLYSNLGQGRVTTRSAKELLRLGLVDPKMVEYDKIGHVKQIRPGALKGMDQFGSDPYQWMKDVLLPSFAKKGITDEKGILNEIGTILPNRTAAALVSLMFLQQEKIEKNMKLSSNAMSSAELVKLAKTNPQGAEEALGKAWENLKIAAGEVLIPIVIPALLKLAEGIRTLGGMINRHPLRFGYLIEGFAGLSAAMAIGGTILLLTASLKGLGLIFSMINLPLKGLVAPLEMMAGIPMLGIAGGLLAIGGAIVGVAALLGKSNVGKIGEATDWLGGKYNPLSLIQDAGRGIGHWINGSATPVTPQPPSNNQKPQTVIMTLDKRIVGEVMIGGFANAAGHAPASSPRYFDSRSMPHQPGGL